MHFAEIDYLAFAGQSIWHKASALSKLVFAAAVVVAVVKAHRLLPLLLIFGLLVLLMLISGVPLKKFIHFLVFPAFFGSLFALSGTGTFTARFWLVIFKSVAAACSLILVLATTGMPAILRCLHRLLPAVVLDALVISYRSFFLLLTKLDNFMTALRVKGGYRASALILNLRHAASALAVLMLYSLEASERMYKVLALRGYREGLFAGGTAYTPTIYDVGPLLLSGLVLFLGVMM